VGIVNQTQESVSRRGVLSRLRRDASGAALLEFAFVAGPFIGLIFAILQVALIFFADQMLDTSTQAASRFIMTGTAQKGAWTPAKFKTETCKTLPTFMQNNNCANLTIDVTTLGSTASSFSSANTGAPVITYDGSGVASMPSNYQPGAKEDIVMVRLTYPWNVVTAPGLNLANMQNGQFLLMATTVTRTEPYE
jgi:Flp pilus assembly protein TadG